MHCTLLLYERRSLQTQSNPAIYNDSISTTCDTQTATHITNIDGLKIPPSGKHSSNLWTECWLAFAERSSCQLRLLLSSQNSSSSEPNIQTSQRRHKIPVSIPLVMTATLTWPRSQSVIADWSQSICDSLPDKRFLFHEVLRENECSDVS